MPVIPEAGLELAQLQQQRHASKPAAGDDLTAAAEQFEAMFLQQMLKSMREATPPPELFDSSASQQLQGMHDDQLAAHLASRGVGLADQLIADLGGQKNPVSD